MYAKTLLIFLITVSGNAACSISAESAVAPIAVSESRKHGKREIADALAAIEKEPHSVENHTRLAVILIKEARISGDFAMNEEAEKAIEVALKLAPTDLQARKIRASLFLTFHRFADGLALAKELEKEAPTDAFVLGVITDALTELGNYPEAVIAAQRLVDQKPSSSSYARVAHLRWLHGDHAGAVELYKMAARTADPMDKEAQCWALTQLGDEYWRNGKFVDAERVYDEALSVMPTYSLALAGKGRVRASVGDLSTGAEYLVKVNAMAPHTDTIILLGDIYSKLGRPEDAARQYLKAQVENELFDAHRVALHWADNDTNLENALQIAQADYEAQKDIYAADTLAWCLFKKGKITEARSMITEAMRLKTRDAKIIFHAGMIEIAIGNTKAAAKLLNDAMKLNPAFDLVQSTVTKEAILRLDSAKSGKRA
jgi:tetratricopeptide (TPR) repeat protein